MTEQLHIDGGATPLTAAGKALTARQARAYALVQSTPGGITADELGAQLHADAGKHHPDTRCTWCASTGKSVLESKAVGPLVIRRRGSGRFEPRDGSGAPVVPAVSAQLRSLPDDFFGEAA